MRGLVFRLLLTLTLLSALGRTPLLAGIINVTDPISRTEAYSFVEHTEDRDTETDFTADATTNSIASGALAGNSTSSTAEHVRTVAYLEIDAHGHASASSFHMAHFDGTATASSAGSLSFEVDVAADYWLFGDMTIEAHGDAGSLAGGVVRLTTDSASAELVLDGHNLSPENEATYPFSHLVSLLPGVTYSLEYVFDAQAPSANDSAEANVIYSLHLESLESVPEPSAGWLACAGIALLSIRTARRQFFRRLLTAG